MIDAGYRILAFASDMLSFARQLKQVGADIAHARGASA